MSYIVTHVSPDWDAIGYAWLMKRFGGAEDIRVVFVNTGKPDPDILANAYSVGDTGSVHDIETLRFDHHQFPGVQANMECATTLAFKYVSQLQDLKYLRPLIALIYQGDTGKPEAKQSREVGIHALLSTMKARKFSDEELLDWGFETLDAIAEGLKAKYESTQSLFKHTVYTSDDGLVVALREAGRAATFAAMEAGARLVVFADYDQNAIGVWRSGEWQSPNCGDLIGYTINWLAWQDGYDAALMPDSLKSVIQRELESWYRHPAGFFSGRGGDKAPRADEIPVDVAEVARLIDSKWKRYDNQ